MASNTELVALETTASPTTTPPITPKVTPVASTRGTGEVFLEISPPDSPNPTGKVSLEAAPAASLSAPPTAPPTGPLPAIPAFLPVTGRRSTSSTGSMKFKYKSKKSESKGSTSATAGATVPATNSTQQDSFGIPEPTEPEYGFPGHGTLPNVTDDAQDWYRKVRVMLSFGVDELSFDNGKLKDVIKATYPLRDALNKIMFSNAVTRAEAATLVRFGRIYARAQGESKDGVPIDKAYIDATGLNGLVPALATIFKSESARRIAEAISIAEKLQAVKDTISRLEKLGGPDNEAEGSTSAGV